MKFITILRYILIAISLSILICCDSTNETDDFNKKNTELNFTTVGKGELNGNGAENIPQQQIVIRNSSDWNSLLTQMNSVNNETKDFTETEFNFSNVILIAVFDKIRNTGGHSIDITNVIQTDAEISVVVGKLKKGNDTQVITQPYHIIKISKTEILITFN